MFEDSQPKIRIDCWEQDCDLATGVENVKGTVNWIEQERTFSAYVQDVVIYMLSFVSIIAVVYIIYAWFRILTWAWEEEVLKKQKWIILYVIIWMVIIWLSYPIINFIVGILNATPKP
jgi:hypothetical protein